MERELLLPDTERRLLASLHSTGAVSGFTHNFYRYPARMSPVFARQVITDFSKPGDTILDPFMGGGTTIVEALASGRRSIGVDLNPIATFVTAAKTTPLGVRDAETVTGWVQSSHILHDFDNELNDVSIDPRLRNLPPVLMRTFDQLLRYVSVLPYPRQRRFARCALLRLGQWAVDSKSEMPNVERLGKELNSVVYDMLSDLESLVQCAGAHGVEKRRMTGNRKILLRSAIGLENSLDVEVVGRPRLVLTSPPYPAVHVLYNRWQIQGRRETPAPYWLIDAPDGNGASYFTMGSRTDFGVRRYFRDLTAAFRSVRAVIDPHALVVQLVSFSDAESQLPAFLTAMEAAGFREDFPMAASREERWRTVPNRRWYNRIDATRTSARELLLFHRPMEPFRDDS